MGGCGGCCEAMVVTPIFPLHPVVAVSVAVNVASVFGGAFWGGGAVGC